MNVSESRLAILAISQVYPPDPASGGQYMADAAAELAKRGHAVTVYTANRGYTDPSIRYRARESSAGVSVKRLPLSSFGKGSILARLVGSAIFLSQSLVRGIWARHVDAVVVSTAPPMASLAGVILASIKRARLVYWVLDVYPDLAIARGVVASDSLLVRAYDWMNRVVLRRADAVVAMDRFMAERLNTKLDVGPKMHVIAPWPLEDHVMPLPRANNPFRATHGLEGKFVVMYSGNHAAANPLGTLIEAARVLEDDPNFVFVFVGEGARKKDVDTAGVRNIVSLPYEPLEAIRYSLAAADLQVVTMGDDMTGIVHPCKVYGVMAAARPVLFIGPTESHVSDFMAEGAFGWSVVHGDVAGTVAAIREAASLCDEQWREMGANARALIDRTFSKAALCGAFADIVADSA